MDIEEPERKKLIDRFSDWFVFEEEVKVRSPVFGVTFRVDVIGKPREKFSNLYFAFEVKKKPYWKLGNFSFAAKQAADYVYCRIEEGRFKGNFINSAYVFMPGDGAQIKDDKFEKYWVHGARNLASKHRVGILDTRSDGKPHWRGTMRLGNEIWYSDKGFSMHAEGVLIGKRPIGGTRFTWAQIQKKLERKELF